MGLTGPDLAGSTATPGRDGSTPSKRKSRAAELHHARAAKNAQRLFGEPDYLLRVAVADSDDYERLHTTRIAALPGVRKARSQIAMKTIRHGPTLPLPLP